MILIIKIIYSTSSPLLCRRGKASAPHAAFTGLIPGRYTFKCLPGTVIIRNGRAESQSLVSVPNTPGVKNQILPQ